MGYITLKQASEKWNISERRIRRLIQEGRIEGAEKIGNAWNIPEEANKPIDRRYKIDEDNFIINLPEDFFDDLDIKYVDNSILISVDNANLVNKSFELSLNLLIILDFIISWGNSCSPLVFIISK